jgi:hypothetical protein
MQDLSNFVIAHLSTGQILRKKESMLRYLPKEGGTDEETIRRGMAYS